MDLLAVRREIAQGKSLYDLPLRVTFYARVSTDKEEQRSSLEHQVQYYTAFIQEKPRWTLVPGYIDEGLSGTSACRRDSFLRMIRDGAAGRFDFIITKEISRFSAPPWTASATPGSCWTTTWGCCSRTTTSTPWTRTASSG